MTRILFPFVGDTVGGSHISALTLARNLPSDEFEAVVGVHVEGTLAEYLRREGVPYVGLPAVKIAKAEPLLPQLYKMITAVAKLAVFLRSQKIDIVHTNDARMHLTWLCATKISRRKMVWHQRNPVSSRRTALYTRAAAVVLTISEHCKSSFPSVMKNRTIQIDNPVDSTWEQNDDAQRSTAECRRKLGLSDKKKAVCWVANWMDRKRPRLFVEMARHVLDRAKLPIVFAMFGEPREPDRTELLELIAELDLKDDLLIMGMRTPIEPWIAACDVLVATAVNEGLGRTLVEAMVVGTPVVAAADGGHLEVVQDGVTGLLVPPDDAEAFADAVIQVLDSPELSEHLARNAYTAAKERYSVQNHVSAVTQIYRSLHMAHARRFR